MSDKVMESFFGTITSSIEYCLTFVWQVKNEPKPLMVETEILKMKLELRGCRPGVPHGPRGCLTDYRGLTPHTSILCLTSDVKHLQAFEFMGKCELVFTIIYLTKNPLSNFLRFSQNLWSRYIAWRLKKPRMQLFTSRRSTGVWQRLV